MHDIVAIDRCWRHEFVRVPTVSRSERVWELLRSQAALPCIFAGKLIVIQLWSASYFYPSSVDVCIVKDKQRLYPTIMSLVDPCVIAMVSRLSCMTLHYIIINTRTNLAYWTAASSVNNA